MEDCNCGKKFFGYIVDMEVGLKIPMCKEHYWRHIERFRKVVIN